MNRFKHRAQFGLDAGGDLIIAKPLTYMNRCGMAVSGLAEAHDLTPREITIIVDDLDLPLGTIRTREGGGAGGHKGLSSIIEAMGSDDFPRIRLGIAGEGRDAADAADYVLSPFESEEEPIVPEILERVAELWEAIEVKGFHPVTEVVQRED